MTNLKEWLVKIGLTLLAVLSPVQPVMTAVFCLVIIDFITGIWASIKKNVPIKSYHMRRTVVKLLAYQAAIVVGFIMETYLLQEMPVVKIIGGLVAMTEGKSFFENLHKITGIDFWALIINKVHGEQNQNKK